MNDDCFGFSYERLRTVINALPAELKRRALTKNSGAERAAYLEISESEGCDDFFRWWCCQLAMRRSDADRAVWAVAELRREVGFRYESHQLDRTQAVWRALLDAPRTMLVDPMKGVFVYSFFLAVARMATAEEDEGLATLLTTLLWRKRSSSVIRKLEQMGRLGEVDYALSLEALSALLDVDYGELAQRG